MCSQPLEAPKGILTSSSSPAVRRERTLFLAPVCQQTHVVCPVPQNFRDHGVISSGNWAGGGRKEEHLDQGEDGQDKAVI